MNIKREEILAVYEAGPEAVITLINTIIAENQKIIEQQAIRISELEERVKYLEERLNKNSRNRSKPPSTDNLASAKPNPKSQRIKSGKKSGGQEGHIGTTLMMVDNPIETRVYTVDRCKNCGKNLQDEIAKDFEDEIKKLLSQSPVIHSDETGSRINGQRHWLHVACTSQMTYYMIHAKRGSVAMDAMGILPGFIGTAVHDFWKPYFKYSCNHSLCNTHLTRELTGIYENYSQPWSNEMKALLLEIKSCVGDKRKISDHLEPDQIRNFEEKYDAMIKIGLEENPPPLILQDQAKKRGKKKQSTAKNLLDRFNGYKDDILRFMHDFEVPFENNQAERDVRMMKVQQKISGTFRSTQGAASFCRIRGYISTVKKNKLSVIDAIMDVFSGKAFIPNIAE